MENINIIEDTRPWGGFKRFTLNQTSTVKIITVKAGEAFSLQYHTNRNEFWHIISGEGTATIGEEKLPASPGKEFSIPPNTNHRMEAATEIKFLEICFGEFEEGDIVRLEDKYGRK